MTAMGRARALLASDTNCRVNPEKSRGQAVVPLLARVEASGRGRLGNTSLCESGHHDQGDIENRQPNQEHRCQQRRLGKELGNHKTHPEEHRGDQDGGEIRSHGLAFTSVPTR